MEPPKTGRILGELCPWALLKTAPPASPPKPNKALDGIFGRTGSLQLLDPASLDASIYNNCLARLGQSSCRRSRSQRGQCGQAARQDGLKENRRSAFAQRPPSHRGGFAMSMTGTIPVRRVLVCMGSKPEFYIAKARECERRAQEMPPALRRTFLSWAAHWRKIASNAAKAEDRRQIEEAGDNRKADKG
jgi:hypothetical protein